MSFSVAHTEKGSGEALVFLHGVGGDAASWEFQLDAFADDYRAIAWDMPGYGRSAPIDPVIFPAFAEALVRLFDHLDINKAHVVGHSIGGMVLQEAVALYPDRFLSLVLSATSPAFGNPTGDFQKKFVEDRLRPLDEGQTMADLAEAAIPMMVSDGADPKGVATAIASMAATDPDVYRATIKCLVTFERRASLGDIAVPTLALAGEFDRNSPAPMVAKMASKISNCKYVCMPGIGHLANQEKPDQYNAAIREFLTSL